MTEPIRVPSEVAEVIVGLLEIAHYALPDTYWRTDSRINAARVLLGDHFPSDDELDRRFKDRTK